MTRWRAGAKRGRMVKLASGQGGIGISGEKRGRKKKSVKDKDERRKGGKGIERRPGRRAVKGRQRECAMECKQQYIG